MIIAMSRAACPATYPVAYQAAHPVTIQVGRPGRDELFLEISLDATGVILAATLRAIGCPDVLKLTVHIRTLLNGQINKIELPEGRGHAEMLMRECLLRARGEWSPPYTDIELCHCRAVPTAVVDEAIVCGSRSVSAISRKTSAGTSCGTCKPDIEAMLKFRNQF